MEKDKLLIVEDDEGLRTQMKWGLSQQYAVLLSENRADALKIFNKERPLVVILDLGLPPNPDGVEEGFMTLTGILKEDSGTKVIIVTGRDDKEHALAAIGQGAYDFLGKPVQLDTLNVILHRAFHVAQLEREHRKLQEQLNYESFEGMLGTSPQMGEVFESIRKVATTDAPVVVQGKSGTGKELAARAIHSRSARRDGPFVAINCGAIPENLLESELFGHEKGAFTGAHIQRKGRIELAHDGTLFLDEISELPAQLQVKLLRFLQEFRVERVGGREEITVDTRVIAASNANLEQAMRENRFREDLYYRLGVVSILLPSLVDREGDIILLAKSFLQRYARQHEKNIAGFAPQALRVIETHGWPGNVRELENRIQRAVIMAEGRKLTPADLELSTTYAGYEGRGLKEAREALERDLIRRALDRHKGNITRAAQELGVSRPTLYELMDKLGIER